MVVASGWGPEGWGSNQSTSGSSGHWVATKININDSQQGYLKRLAVDFDKRSHEIKTTLYEMYGGPFYAYNHKM